MNAAEIKDGLPVILFETQESWGNWLGKNKSATGVWVRIAKKGSGINSINYKETLEVALCFGWIDGVSNKFDEKTWVQRFTPRKPNSKWSKINKIKAEELISAGKMKPSGMAAIEIAKQKGIWDAAYDSQKTIEIPEDLQVELDKNPEAAEFFKSLESVNRYAILYRLQTTRNPEIRTKKLAQFIEMLKRKEKIHNLNS
jgi:uncharacterized protein YdeI (YjbR/CyaY-like superfamily)